jgi:hypothetical protein
MNVLLGKRTTKRHLDVVRFKLGVERSRELGRRAIQLGLVQVIWR